MAPWTQILKSGVKIAAIVGGAYIGGEAVKTLRPPDPTYNVAEAGKIYQDPSTGQVYTSNPGIINNSMASGSNSPGNDPLGGLLSNLPALLITIMMLGLITKAGI